MEQTNLASGEQRRRKQPKEDARRDPARQRRTARRRSMPPASSAGVDLLVACQQLSQRVAQRPRASSVPRTRTRAARQP